MKLIEALVVVVCILTVAFMVMRGTPRNKGGK